MSPRTGRPPSDNPRKNVRSVHLSDTELELIETAAGKVGQPVTAYIRDAVLAKARRQK